MKDLLLWIWSEATEKIGHIISNCYNFLSKAITVIIELIPKIVEQLQKD